MIAIYTTAEQEVYVSVFGILTILQGEGTATVTLVGGMTLETKKTAHELGLEITELMLKMRVGR